ESARALGRKRVSRLSAGSELLGIRLDLLWGLAVDNHSGRADISKGMEMIKKTRIFILGLAMLMLAVFVDAQGTKRRGATGAAVAKTIRIDLSKEKVGSESAKFLSVVGNWVIVEDGGKKCLAVDGRQWMRGQPAGGLAQKAREIYGSRHEEFIDNVKAFAYFPYAVAREIDNFSDGEISLQFKLVAGQLDQCAGILFNLKSNGDYVTVRFNGKEDNVVLWTFNKGKRSFVKRGTENVPLAMNQWNALKIAIHGTSLQASLNGKLLLEYTL